MTMSSKRAWYADYTLQVRDPFAGLSPRLVALIKGELTEGEEILWMQQRYSRFNIKKKTLINFIYYPVVHIGLPALFIGFAGLAFWQWLVGLLPLIVLIGGGLLAYFLPESWKEEPVYMLTSRRIIKFNIVPTYPKVLSYHLHIRVKSKYLETTVRSDQSGTLYFARSWNANSKPVKVSFDNVWQVEQVKELIRRSLVETSENSVSVLSPDLRKALKANLGEDEKVFWLGMPDLYWLERNASKRGVAVGLFYLAFLIFVPTIFMFGLFMGIGNSIRDILIWFGVMFGVVIVAVILDVFFVGEKLRKRIKAVKAIGPKTVYALTDRRFLKVTAQDAETETVEEYDSTRRANYTRLKKVKHKGNVADLYLMESETGKRFKPRLELLSVREADEVEQLIKQQLNTVSI